MLAPNKKNHIVFERAELGLSSHVLISVFIFLTKIDFFEGEGLKTTMYFWSS
jgi:hypothetical protein